MSKITCPSCGKSLRIEEIQASSRYKCPRCQSVFSGSDVQPPGSGADSQKDDWATRSVYNLADPNGLPNAKADNGSSTAAAKCPSCHSDLPSGTVLCVKCGYDLRTQPCAFVSGKGAAGPGAASSDAPTTAAATVQILPRNAILAVVATGVLGVGVFALMVRMSACVAPLIALPVVVSVFVLCLQSAGWIRVARGTEAQSNGRSRYYLLAILHAVLAAGIFGLLVAGMPTNTRVIVSLLAMISIVPAVSLGYVAYWMYGEKLPAEVLVVSAVAVPAIHAACLGFMFFIWRVAWPWGLSDAGIAGVSYGLASVCYAAYLSRHLELDIRRTGTLAIVSTLLPSLIVIMCFQHRALTIGEIQWDIGYPSLSEKGGSSKAHGGRDASRTRSTAMQTERTGRRFATGHAQAVIRTGDGATAQAIADDALEWGQLAFTEPVYGGYTNERELLGTEIARMYARLQDVRADAMQSGDGTGRDVFVGTFGDIVIDEVPDGLSAQIPGWRGPARCIVHNDALLAVQIDPAPANVFYRWRVGLFYRVGDTLKGRYVQLVVDVTPSRVRGLPAYDIRHGVANTYEREVCEQRLNQGESAAP